MRKTTLKKKQLQVSLKSLSHVGSHDVIPRGSCNVRWVLQSENQIGIISGGCSAWLNEKDTFSIEQQLKRQIPCWGLLGKELKVRWPI